MSLEVALQRLTAAIPDCLASGYLDTESGHLLGVSATDSRLLPGLGILGGAATDLLQTATVSLIETLFTTARGADAGGTAHFQEVVVLSGDSLHIFLRTRRRPNRVACFLCRKGANIGLVLAKARLGLGVMEAT